MRQETEEACYIVSRFLEMLQDAKTIVNMLSYLMKNKLENFDCCAVNLGNYLTILGVHGHVEAMKSDLTGLSMVSEPCQLSYNTKR